MKKVFIGRVHLYQVDFHMIYILQVLIGLTRQVKVGIIMPVGFQLDASKINNSVILKI